MFHNLRDTRAYTAHVNLAYSVQYPDCYVEYYLESREGEEVGGEGKGG